MNKKPRWGSMFILQALGRWRQVDAWGLLTSQVSLLGEFQTWDYVFKKKIQKQGELLPKNNIQGGSLWPPYLLIHLEVLAHMNTICTHMCTHLYTLIIIMFSTTCLMT